MTVLVICDLHYEKRHYKGVDESRAWQWLLEIIDYHRPEWLLSCGDWGTAVNPREFYELLKRVVVLTIYGNHEDIQVLSSLYNVKSNKYLPILMADGEVYDLNGLRVAGISGVISKKRKTKKGVPRKTVEEYLEAAKKLTTQNVDVLLLHEAPYLPDLFPFMQQDFKSEAALEAIRIIRPRLVVNGHMHPPEGYKLATIPPNITYINIDSSQAARTYLILRPQKSIEIWRDRTLVLRVSPRA